MTERGSQQHAIADRQTGELLDLVSTLDEATSRLPCPGREKLGDGTVAANARAHGRQLRTDRGIRWRDRPRVRAAARAQRRSSPTRRSVHSDDTDLDGLIEQIGVTRDSLACIAEFSDSQLDAVPPAGSFRSADGDRTVEQVLAALLRHQRHQLDALRTATGRLRPSSQALPHTGESNYLPELDRESKRVW
jgi:hypothetical protein